MSRRKYDNLNGAQVKLAMIGSSEVTLVLICTCTVESIDKDMHNDRAPWPGPAARFRNGSLRIKPHAAFQPECSESGPLQISLGQWDGRDGNKLAAASSLGRVEFCLSAYRTSGAMPNRVQPNRAWEGGTGSGDWLVSLHDRCRNHMKFDGRCSSSPTPVRACS